MEGLALSQRGTMRLIAVIDNYTRTTSLTCCQWIGVHATAPRARTRDSGLFTPVWSWCTCTRDNWLFTPVWSRCTCTRGAAKQRTTSPTHMHLVVPLPLPPPPPPPPAPPPPPPSPPGKGMKLLADLCCTRWPRLHTRKHGVGRGVGWKISLTWFDSQRHHAKRKSDSQRRQVNAVGGQNEAAVTAALDLQLPLQAVGTAARAYPGA